MWMVQRELLLSLHTKGECLTLVLEALFFMVNQLERNDMMMVRWMCKVSLKDRKTSQELQE